MDICKKSALWLAITAAMSANAVAEQKATPEQENVVIWGTKVSSSSESLTTDDLSLKQADHMSDLLRDIPGVDVGGTHSVNQRINIRGLGETNLDIRLDGASQHANMFHHIGNLTLNPDILKSADVQVGNNSVTKVALVVRFILKPRMRKICWWVVSSLVPVSSAAMPLTTANKVHSRFTVN